MKLEFSTDIRIFMKSYPMGDELFHVERQTWQS